MHVLVKLRGDFIRQEDFERIGSLHMSHWILHNGLVYGEKFKFTKTFTQTDSESFPNSAASGEYCQSCPLSKSGTNLSSAVQSMYNNLPKVRYLDASAIIVFM